MSFDVTSYKELGGNKVTRRLRLTCESIWMLIRSKNVMVCAYDARENHVEIRQTGHFSARAIEGIEYTAKALNDLDDVVIEARSILDAE